MIITDMKAHSSDVIKIVNVADAHISAHTPSSYKIDYFEHTMATLDQVIAFAIKEKVDAFIWTGDQFHLKSASRNPNVMVAEINKRCRKLWDAGIWSGCIGGNHDLRLGSLEGLVGQPLELMISSGMMRLLDQEELRIRLDTNESESYSLRITGASYNHGQAEECRGKKRDGDNYLVSVGHFWFGPATGEFFGEPMFGPDYLGQGEPDMYLIGHHHDDQGVIEQDGKHYVVPGSLNRTGAHKGDVDRRPAASYVTVSPKGVTVKVLRPKVASSAEYLDTEKREQVMRESKEMEALVQTLKNTTIQSSDPRAILKGLEATQEAKDRATNYLEQAEQAVA